MLDLSRLTAEQRRVVLAGDGPLLVVAGPGSGKTTVLAAYAAHLVGGRGVGPASVLAITFTTAAARELRARLAGVLGDPGRAIDVATFHAFGLRVIRQWCQLLDLGSGPVAVYGAADTRAVLREAVEVVGFGQLADDPATLSHLARAVERRRLAYASTCSPTDAVSGGTGPDLMSGNVTGGDALASSPALVTAVAEAYEALLCRRRAVDYPAMLSLPLRLFERHGRVLRLYQDIYRYVLCDEAQDVCAAQYALLRLLAVRHRNLVLVGDPRQSLFAFRGADAQLFDRFACDFPERRVLTLEQNFRSVGRLVEVANALAARLGHPRPLWTTNPPGDTARLYAAADEEAEATFVAAEIGRLLATGAIAHPGEAAVLYRTNRQAQALAVALRNHRLPYRVRGGGDYFARREVQDAIAYLRLAHDPDDLCAVSRVLNAPPRRLGRLATALPALARERPMHLAALPALAHDLGPQAVAAAEAFVALVADCHAAAARLEKRALLELVLERSGYRAWTEAQGGGEARLRSLADLAAMAADSDASGEDLGSWLGRLEVEPRFTETVDAADSAAGTGEDGDERPTEGSGTRRVLLTTVHAAKGGEWAAVFVVGMEDGLLPHARALAPDDAPGGAAAVTADGEAETDGGIGEERRVAYVAVTRPRDRLYVTYCQARRRGDRLLPRQPSRFLREIPTRLLTPIAPAA